MATQNDTNATQLDEELERRIRDSLKAYSAGDNQFFDFLRQDVRVFVLNSAEPIIGREAFEASFGPTLRNARREVKVIQRDAQVSDCNTVLAQTLEITSEEVVTVVRQTVIWERDPQSGWVMTHIHNALVGQPLTVGTVPSTPAAVRVLNERIATVAAAVGVAQ
jgi:ketosteroid isomerase-like protein